MVRRLKKLEQTPRNIVWSVSRVAGCVREQENATQCDTTAAPPEKNVQNHTQLFCDVDIFFPGPPAAWQVMCDNSLVSWHPDLQIWACLRRPSTFRNLRGCILHTRRTGASLPPNCEPHRRTGCCGVAARPRNAWQARLSCRPLCAWPGSTLLRPDNSE